MGRYSVKHLRDEWDAYKADCDGKKTIKTEFSSKSETFVTMEVPTPVPYDIQGFCTRLGITRQAWYKVYVHDKDGRYTSICDQIAMECENSKRVAFETGTLPAKLAGLWMSAYDGYAEKVAATVRDGGAADSPESKNPMTLEEKERLLAAIAHEDTGDRA